MAGEHVETKPGKNTDMSDRISSQMKRYFFQDLASLNITTGLACLIFDYRVIYEGFLGSSAAIFFLSMSLLGGTYQANLSKYELLRDRLGADFQREASKEIEKSGLRNLVYSYWFLESYQRWKKQTQL